MKERKRMISEAARELGLETHHLRTWEDEFGILVPRNEKGYRRKKTDSQLLRHCVSLSARCGGN